MRPVDTLRESQIERGCVCVKEGQSECKRVSYRVKERVCARKEQLRESQSERQKERVKEA